MKKSQYRYSRLLSLAILALPLAACDNDTQSGSGVERPKAGQPNQPGSGTTTTTTGADTMPDITTGTTTDSGLPDTTTPDSGSTSSSDSTSSSTTTTTTTTDSSSSSTDTSSSDDSSSSDTDSSGTDPKVDWKGDDFEGSVGDWELDKDKIWKIGAPDAPAGPNAKGGNKVIGTVLDGDYPTGRMEAVLHSPEFVIPKGESARLRYWQWYNLGDSDSGVVDLRIDGVGRPDDDDKDEIEGRWRFQHSVIGSSRGRWVQVIVDLPKMYEGRRAQLAFTLEGRGDQSRPGWFMDDFRIETGPMNNKAQGFENGWEDWSVQGSVWDIGAPMTSKGPKPVTGKGLAGTDLFGDYPTESRVSSRLLSPRFVVPKDAKEPEMTYQSWHKLDRRDQGEVQIREEYGRWRSLRNTRVTGDDGDKWEKRTVDLSDYAGKEIQVGFLIDTRRSSDGDLGWYIDDVSLDLK